MHPSQFIQVAMVVASFLTYGIVEVTKYQLDKLRVAPIYDCPPLAPPFEMHAPQIVLGKCIVNGEIVPHVARPLNDVEAKVRNKEYEVRTAGEEFFKGPLITVFVGIAIAAIFIT